MFSSEKTSRDLEQGILAALAFYDIFDYPLTSLEIWRFFQDPDGELSETDYSLGQIMAALKNSEKLQELVSERHGFYMLAGREDLYGKRMARHNYAQQRWRKAQRLIKWLSGVPFLKMVALCNMFSIDTPAPDSDIDVVMIARRGRIWLVRLIVTTLIALTGQWRHRHVANKMCLSFFLTDDNLDLQKLYKEKGVWHDKDPYLYNWVALVAPVYDRSRTARKFWQANGWIKKHIPNAYLYRPVPLRKVKASALDRGWRNFWEFVWQGGFGDWVEKTVRWWQLQYMKTRGDQEWLKNPNVVCSDEVLKFHEIDRREHFREEFAKRIGG